MKNKVKYLILGVLLLIALSLCSTLILYIFDLIMEIKFENIWYTGFKVAFVALIILVIDWYRRSRHMNK